ncbi:hypothetical protein HID58_070797 [Brassica napus]|uniref:Uncharacterized protein n=1 Tax=Brassica napus TaxID=3708 RepID=A0ABQ7YZV1_BRANA|nr:hypothetical protein HID58_070797 [Brassica napus]
MTSVRGSVDNPVKKEKIEINTAPPPSQWEKWCKGKGQGLQLSDSPLPQDASPQASLYYISEVMERIHGTVGVDVDRLYFPLFVNVRAGEAMMKRPESRIEEREDAIVHCEEKTSECIRELKSIKAFFVCCLVMVFMYHTYA